MRAIQIIIFFIIVLSGCSGKYLDSREGELVGRECGVLDATIVAQDEENISLGLQINDSVEVVDSIKAYVEFRQDNSMREKGVDFEKVCAIGGCTVLASVLALGLQKKDPECFTMWTFIAIGGGLLSLYYIWEGISPFNKYSRLDSYYVRKNSICINSELLFYGKVKVLVEKTKFAKTYYTDENGNIKLKFDDIIPKPTEVDSVLNLIIKYEEMVDTVNVKIR